MDGGAGGGDILAVAVELRLTGKHVDARIGLCYDRQSLRAN